MAHIQTESEWQEEMSAKIVEFVRHELYMELRYLKLALSQLQLKSDPDLRAFATDGAYLYVAPEWLIGIFEKNSSTICSALFDKSDFGHWSHVSSFPNTRAICLRRWYWTNSMRSPTKYLIYSLLTRLVSKNPGNKIRRSSSNT